MTDLWLRRFILNKINMKLNVHGMFLIILNIVLTQCSWLYQKF